MWSPCGECSAFVLRLQGKSAASLLPVEEILNILPIPVLDGGWLVFLIIEKIKGSPVSERTMAYFQWAGLIFVLGLMVYVTWNDVIRLIDGF